MYVVSNNRSSVEIIEEYLFVRTRLKSKFQYYYKLAKKEFNLPSAYPYLQYSKPNDVFSKFRYLELEINRKYVFELIAPFEANLINYFRKIVKRKSYLGKLLKKNVSIKKIRGQEYMMFRDLIEILNQYINHNLRKPKLYCHFLEIVEYRNWLAHGRAFKLSNHLLDNNVIEKRSTFDLHFVYLIIEKVRNLLPNYPL